MISLLILVWSIELIQAPDVVRAASMPPPDFLFTAFADNQQRLQSGIVRMEGAVLGRATDGSQIDGQTTIFCAFDSNANLFRFDRTEPMRPFPLGKNGKLLSPNTEPTLRGGKYAETSNRVVSWSSEHPNSVWMMPVGLPRRKVAPNVFPFDPRILGMANWITVTSAYQPDQMIPGFRTRLATATATSAEVRPGVTRVRWTGTRDNLEIDFDRSVGYMPVRYADFTTAKPGKPAEPYDSAVTTWQLRGGVYVPVTARFQDGPDDARDLQRYDLKLTWEMVNGPVDERLTTARGMGLPPGILISDHTSGELGRPLGKIGDLKPNPRLAYVENHPVQAPQPPPPPDARWKWLLAAVAAVTVVAGGVLAWRRRRR